MRNLLIVAATALLSLPALGQNVLQGANPDVLNGLFFSGRSEMKMTVARSLPASMTGWRVPAGFTLIGTGVRGSGETQSTMVALKSSLAADKAHAALVDALRADGFEIEKNQFPGQTFNVPSTRMESVVCRRGERRSLLVHDGGAVRYANILMGPDTRKLACNEADPRLTMGAFGQRIGMPQFNFPPSSRMVNGLGGGGGGSNETYATSTRIQSPDTAASLAEHLATQMPDQGWRREAAWNGPRSAGSTWKGEVNGRPAWGSLEIVSFGDGIYEVGFVLQTR